MLFIDWLLKDEKPVHLDGSAPDTLTVVEFL